jgi:hypothetical protein
MAKVRLGMAFDELSGKMPGGSLVQSPSGPVVRRAPRYRRPVSPAQREGIDRLAEVNLVWSTLTREEALAWNAFAQTLPRTDPVSGRRYTPQGNNAFAMLGVKYRQMHPQAPVPRTPPTGAFAPEPLPLAVTAGPGLLRFTAGAPNASGCVTELLLQPLVNVRRSPGKRYTHAGFVEFQAAGESADLAVTPGAYACAFRLVESATGRARPYEVLGVVEVFAMAEAA